MSENSQQILCGASVVPPEELDIEEHPAEVAADASLDSNAVDLLDNIGKDEFKYIYLDLIHSVKIASFEYQRRFIKQYLDRMEEIYDYRFPTEYDIDQVIDLADFYEFIQFVEFDHVEYIGAVWKQIGADIYKIDIEQFCKNNAQKIINESEKQLDSFDFNEKINLFLRTYYKEGFIQWFVENSKVIKPEIKITQLT